MIINCSFKECSFLKKRKSHCLHYPFFEIHPKKQIINDNDIHTGIFLDLYSNIGYILFSPDKEMLYFSNEKGEIIIDKEILKDYYFNSCKKISNKDIVGYIVFSYSEDMPIENIILNEKKSL